MATHESEIRQVASFYGCDLSPAKLHASYRATVDAWSELACAPDAIVCSAPSVKGIGSRWGTFARKKKKIESTRFVGVDHLAISKMPRVDGVVLNPSESYPSSDWECHARYHARNRTVFLGWIPSVIGGAAEGMHLLAREIADIVRPQYGYYQSAPFRSSSRDAASPPGPGPIQEYQINNVYWVRWQDGRNSAPLLKNVYEISYLDDKYLSAPMGKSSTTLREWIAVDSDARGELSPYTDMLYEWWVPREVIPQVREELFRAGRLFFHAFLRQHRPRALGTVISDAGIEVTRWEEEPYYREDIMQGWEAPDRIPEIFTSDWYRVNILES